MHDVTHLIGLLAVMLATAKAFGWLAKLVDQPAVLGELTAGVVLGLSVTGLVDPKAETLHTLTELGVVILLFEIGLETDLRKLLQAGPVAAVVALVGVALPFAFGYAVCAALELPTLVAVVAGASLIGNVIGSNLFNVLGINTLISPLPISPEIAGWDTWWMLGVTVMLFPLMATGLRINRRKGAGLLAVYVVYTVLLLVR
jgi:NhaP-type Na+/H+ or K+/H+ antiporter